MALGSRVVLICLLAVLITVAGAVAALWLGSGGEPEEDPADRTLEAGYSAFIALERERYERLALAAEVLSEAPRVVALIEAGQQPSTTDELVRPPIPPEVRAAALDELNRRRWNLGFAAVLGPDGETLLRTDDPLDTGGRAGVPSTTSTGREDGLWYAEGELYQTVTVPILPELALPDAGIQGHLRVGQPVDDIWPREIAKIGGGEVAFVVMVRGGAQVIAGTLDSGLAQPLLDFLISPASGPPVLENVARRGRIVAHRELVLAGETWVARFAPLRGSGEVTAAAVVLLTPGGVGGGMGPWPQLAAIGVAALAALLLALPLAFAAGRTGHRPLLELGELVDKARRGGATPAQVRAAGRGSTTGLAEALAGLLADQQQRSTLREAVRAAQAAPDGDAGAPEPERPLVALLGVELRRHARATEPRESVERLQKDVGVLRRVVQAHGGVIGALLGHRVLAVFRGERPARRALAAAARSLEALSTAETAFDEIEPPVLAIASGRVVEGRLPEEGGRLQPVFLGLPTQLLETVLREAAPGEIYFSRDVHRELKDELADAGVQPVAQNGILTPQPLYALSGDAAARIVGADAAGDSGGEGEAGGGAAATVTAGPPPGTVLDGRFEVRGAAGEGPVGTVYRAFDRELGRVVALKMFRPGAISNTDRLTALDSPLQSFRGLTHPHIVRLFDYGTLEGRPFLSREWVEGLDLTGLLRRLPRLPPVAALGAARQLTAAVAAVHGQGLTHLRLKPGNVLFAAGGSLRVSDFGVAVVAPPLLDLGSGGGAGWLAPEQQDGEPGDARSDVYTCGLLIHLLFAGPSTGGPTGARSPELPAALAQIIRRCRAAEPGQRYADAGELGRALETVAPD